YEALSYAWGSNDQTEKRPCVSFIPITPNLQSALKRLRQRSTTRVLWVDQLCINQEDVEERSSQVQLMGHIYQKASKTVVWLGEEDEHGRGPLGAFLQTMGHDADLTTYNWQAFNSFYNRPWFGRLWILQEIAFSKEVVI
ncbi:heterokaryon incompatibility, partial [Hyaloscypha variabilis F]